ncbi:hypothetical protein ElyMa_001943500, partial [Elysia marginata]
NGKFNKLLSTRHNSPTQCKQKSQQTKHRCSASLATVWQQTLARAVLHRHVCIASLLHHGREKSGRNLASFRGERSIKWENMPGSLVPGKGGDQCGQIAGLIKSDNSCLKRERLRTRD